MSQRDGRLLIVRQVDHQAQCGAMAAAWGGEGFERIPHWLALARAAAWHDEGWRRWEERPQVDGDGRPLDFIAVDRRVHVDIYRRGIAYALSIGERTGLLVSMHGRGLYEARLGLDGEPRDRTSLLPEVQQFLREQDDLEARLGPRLGAASELWDAYRLLQAWDLLSLYVVWRALPAGREGYLTAVPRGPGDKGVTIRLRPGGPETVELDPYPFRADPIALPVAAREVPDRPYGSAEELSGALAAAPWRSCRIVARAG